jgi:hypothetical protein
MSIALRLHDATHDPQYAVTATAYPRTARRCARGTKWLDYLASAADTVDELNAPPELDQLDQLAVDNILGRPATFDSAITNAEAL